MNYYRCILILVVIFFSCSTIAATDTLKYDSVSKFYHEKSEELPEFVDENPLLTKIINYDIMLNRVVPLPPRHFNADSVFREMNPLFMPLVFGNYKTNFNIKSSFNDSNIDKLKTSYVDSLLTILKNEIFIVNLDKKILVKAEKYNLDKIVYEYSKLPKPERLIYQLSVSKPKIVESKNNAEPSKLSTSKNLPTIGFMPWTSKGNSKLQLSQTYISPNWSKGGESNMAGLASFYYELNYNNLNNVRFNNSFEVKVGLNTVNSDSLRDFNISTDQIRFVSNLGVKMYNNWYYSLSGEFLSQSLNNYKKNTMILKSSFLSPAKLFISLGVDYKKSDRKLGYDFSMVLSPLTYKMNYLLDNVNLNPTSYGIEAGKHFGHELGSKVSANMNWKLTDKVYWRSKMYYFTDFKYQDSEWENTLDIGINNYFATQIFVLTKLDDRLKRNPGEPLLQMQELFSFGLTYRW
jgi:hypothetical protein